jgi:AcrR family transcriptional regulator
MAVPDFQRARSAAAKQLRESAILEAARALGAERGIRQITLTDIGEAVGMHKSAMLRYFETREEIFLRLTADGWREWSAALRARLEELAAPMPAALRARLEELAAPMPAAVAGVFASTLAARGLFCDLLAQAPLNLERHVSLDAVRTFKLVTLAEVDAIVAVVRRLLPRLTERDSVDLIAAATAMSGAFWQMATPGPEVAALYRSDPRLAHAVVDVQPRVARLLEAMLKGMLA